MTDDETTYQPPEERKHEGPVRRIIHGIEDIFGDDDPDPAPEPDHEPSHAQIPRPGRD